MTRELSKPHAKVKQFTPFLEPKDIKFIIRRGTTNIIRIYQYIGATQWSLKILKIKNGHYINFHEKRKNFTIFSGKTNKTSPVHCAEVYTPNARNFAEVYQKVWQRKL